MTGLASAVVGLLLALVVLAVAVRLLLSRWSRSAERRLESAVGDLHARMEAMVRDLSVALERAEDEGRRLRRLADLAVSIDLDDVLDRTLEATRAIEHADAALVSLAGAAEDGRALVATVGLSRNEALAQAPFTGPPDGRPVRAIGIAYRYGHEQLAESDVIHAGVAVPLPLEPDSEAYLAVFTRLRGHEFDETAVAELEEIARRAAPAIANARRFRDARRQADLDALTGLHNRRYFHETLGREVARAQRYDRRLSLAVFDLDDFKAVNDRIGHLEGDAVLAAAAERIRDAVRASDIPCRVGGDEFGVILPESGAAEGDRLAGRLQRSLASEPIADGVRLSLSAGVAELGPDEDANSLFRRADAELYRAKDARKGGNGPRDLPTQLPTARRA